MDTPSPELRRTHLTRLTTPKSVARRQICKSPAFLAHKTVPEFCELSMSPLQLLDSPVKSTIMTPSESPGRKSLRLQKQTSTPSEEIPQSTPSSNKNQGFVISSNVFAAVKAKRRLIEELPAIQNKASPVTFRGNKESPNQERASKKPKITPNKTMPLVKLKKNKRKSFGQINSGVSHRIRKPEKRVKSSLSISLSDLKKAKAEGLGKNPWEALNKTLPSTQETASAQSIIQTDSTEDKKIVTTLPMSEPVKPLPQTPTLKNQLPQLAKQEKKAIVISPKVITRNWNQRYRKETRERKFFKSRGSEEEKSNRVVTVSVNENLKLQIHESPIATRKSPRKAILSKSVQILQNSSAGLISKESSIGILSQDWEDDDDGVNSMDLSSNIEDILKGLSDDESTQVPNNKETTEMADEKENNSANKLFPLFYNNNQVLKPQTESRTEKRSNPKTQWLRALTDGENQMLLDAGQKAYGAIQCPDCRMVYHLKDPGDELLHTKVHESVQDALKFVGWKKERVIRRFDGAGYVIAVHHGDSANWWKKIESVLEKVVDQELGFSEVGIRNPETTKVYLYIAEKKIVGLVVAQNLSRGFRMLSNSTASSGKCCSTDPSHALCGVNRVWTHGSFRRRKIASRLLDAMRTDFIYGKVIEVDEIAFSDPTENGLAFAQSYTKRQDFLVYNM